ncbi:MAG: hypothetical protein V4443_05025 [Pseudomonadota bacterium]
MEPANMAYALGIECGHQVAGLCRENFATPEAIDRYTDYEIKDFEYLKSLYVEFTPAMRLAYRLGVEDTLKLKNIQIASVKKIMDSRKDGQRSQAQGE